MADIGGTTTRVALAQGGQQLPGTQRRLRNDDHHGAPEILAEALRQIGGAPDLACVAVAGRVEAGCGRLTNRPWRIDPDTMSRATGAARGLILNDLQAQALALPHLAPGDRLALATAGPLPGSTGRGAGPWLAVGVGTGFNASALHLVAGRWVALAAESGQARLPLPDARDNDTDDAARLRTLVTGIEAETGRAACIEDLLSGRGLERLHAAMADSRHDPFGSGDQRLSAERIAAAKDPASRAALALFARLLGRVLRDLTLHHLPLGGIALTGGVMQGTARRLAQLGLLQEFFRPGAAADLPAGIPLDLVLDDAAALTGLAHACLDPT